MMICAVVSAIILLIGILALVITGAKTLKLNINQPDNDDCDDTLDKAIYALDVSTTIFQSIALFVLSISLLYNCIKWLCNCSEHIIVGLVAVGFGIHIFGSSVMLGGMACIAGFAVNTSFNHNLKYNCFTTFNTEQWNGAYDGILFSFGIIALVIAVIYFVVSGSKWIKELREDYRPIEDMKKKYAYLYGRYLRIGYSTKHERDILEPWFVFQYIVYLTSALVWIVRASNTFFKNQRTQEPDRDEYIQYAMLNISFDAIAFLIPYSLGLWINRLHTICYDRMLSEYLKYKNKRLEEYLEKPDSDKEDYFEGYFEHYSGAMSMAISKNPDFDFNPSLLGMKIPLNSSGYIFAIYISIAASIFTGIR